jgi:hypothetical protein
MYVDQFAIAITSASRIRISKRNTPLKKPVN